MEEFKKARKSFTKFENLTLVKILQSYKILQSKKTDQCTNTLKIIAWKSIARDFNSMPGVNPRHYLQLRKRWDNIKNEAKKSKERLEMDGIVGIRDEDMEREMDWLDKVETIAPHLFAVPIKEECEDHSYFSQHIENEDFEANSLKACTKNEFPSQPTTSCDVDNPFSIPTSSRQTPYLSTELQEKSEYSFTCEQRNELHELRIDEAKLRISKLNREIEMAEEMHLLTVKRLNMLFACKF